LPDIATNSAAITKEKLPPSYSQFYQNGTDNRLYCNINNSIFSIDLINANAAKRKTGTFVNSDLATGILTITHNFGLSAPYMAQVTIIRNNGKPYLPDYTCLENTITVDLLPLGNISGIWGYIIIA